jgi:hypothetical protein
MKSLGAVGIMASLAIGGSCQISSAIFREWVEGRCSEGPKFSGLKRYQAWATLHIVSRYLSIKLRRVRQPHDSQGRKPVGYVLVRQPWARRAQYVAGQYSNTG